MKKEHLRNFIIGAVLGISGFGFAVVSLPNTFSAGSPIRAAEVNANFSALKTALETAAGINDGAISRAKLSITGTVADGKVLKAQGSDLVWGDAGISLPFVGSITPSSAGAIAFRLARVTQQKPQSKAWVAILAWLATPQAQTV